MKQCIRSLVLTSSLGLVASVCPTLAQAELSASATIASTYLWRGFELGSGTPAFYADLVYSNSGFYGGLWLSSGDTTGGTEYDLFVGYGGSVGDFSYDVSYVTYVYPTGQFNSVGADTEGTPGDFAEAIVTLGYDMLSVTYKDNVAGDNAGGYALPEDYWYLSASLGFEMFGFTVGQHNEAVDDAIHFDATYNFNEKLSFTFSTIVDSDADEDPDPTFVASYTFPIM